MMSKDNQWVWIHSKEELKPYKSYPEYLDHNGKWIIYGPKEAIEDIGYKMLDIVGKDNILEAKFSRNPALVVPDGYLLGKDHALIAYCDDRNKESVKRKLKDSLGVGSMFWKYDRDTLREISERSVHD